MSAQAATAVERPAAIVDDAAHAGERRPASFAGAWLLSGAMVVSGVLTYAFHVLAARTLGAEAYGQIAVLWGAMFLAAIVLFRPVEQTASRAIAHRIARGEEIRTVVHSVTLITCALLGATLAVGLAGWSVITDRLFEGDGLMTGMLLAGIVAYGLSYFVRGLVGGIRWFNGYGIVLIADAVGRLAVAVPLVFAASKNLAAVAVVAAGLVGAVAPLYAWRRLLDRVPRQAGERFHLGSAVTFAVPASVMAAADQLLVNGAPLLVILGHGSDKTRSAGIVFAATMLVRAPVYVFQGVAASLLPNLTVVHTAEKGSRFRSMVVRSVLVLAAAGACIAVGAAAVGPQAMRMLYGAGFDTTRTEFALLGIGVGCYLAAATFSQALLALANNTRAALAWALSAVCFVGVFVAVGGSSLGRVSLAFAVAMLLDTGLLAVLLFWRLRSR